MNAVVEVATVVVVAEVSEVAPVTTAAYFPLEVPTPVATSTTHAVLSMGNHSISAVAPDAYFQIGGLAKA